MSLTDEASCKPTPCRLSQSLQIAALQLRPPPGLCPIDPIPAIHRSHLVWVTDHGGSEGSSLAVDEEFVYITRHSRLPDRTRTFLGLRGLPRREARLWKRARWIAPLRAIDRMTETARSRGESQRPFRWKPPVRPPPRASRSLGCDGRIAGIGSIERGPGGWQWVADLQLQQVGTWNETCCICRPRFTTPTYMSMIVCKLPASYPPS